MQLSQLLEQIENQFRLPRFLSQIVSDFERNANAQQSTQQSEGGIQRQVEEKVVPEKRHTRRREPLTYERVGSRKPKVIRE